MRPELVRGGRFTGYFGLRRRSSPALATMQALVRRLDAGDLAGAALTCTFTGSALGWRFHRLVLECGTGSYSSTGVCSFTLPAAQERYTAGTPGALFLHLAPTSAP